jgi:hypothetical protein
MKSSPVRSAGKRCDLPHIVSRFVAVPPAISFYVRCSRAPSDVLDLCSLRLDGELGNHSFRLPVHSAAPLGFEKLSQTD